MKNTKMPAIRFKGFNDDWEQRKLSELATMHARIGWQNLRTSEFLDAGDYMLITGTDFEDGKVNYSTCHYVEKERYDQDKNIQIKNGNILITKDGTLGKVAYVEGLSLPATLNAGVFNVEVKDENETDSKYLFQFLKAPFLMDYVSKKATGGTIKHLNQNILVDFPIATPSKAEQVRIGEYFSNLDNLITLHQRKLEKIELLKKSMLKKMFTRDTENIPKIRFDRYTDDWEQRKLGDLTTYRNGTGHEEKQSDVGKYELVNLNSISIDGGLKPSGKFIDEESETLIKDDLVMVLSDVGHGDLLGRVAIITENNRFVLNQRVALLRNNGFADTKYLFSYINAHQRYFKLQGAGSSQLNISRGSVENFEVLLPKRDEQKQIGECFSNLDHLITLHQRKLEKLKKVKKSLLEHMFAMEK